MQITTYKHRKSRKTNYNRIRDALFVFVCMSFRWFIFNQVDLYRNTNIVHIVKQWNRPKNSINALANANKCESKFHTANIPTLETKTKTWSVSAFTQLTRIASFSNAVPKKAPSKNKYTLVLITNIQNYSCCFMFIARLGILNMYRECNVCLCIASRVCVGNEGAGNFVLFWRWHGLIANNNSKFYIFRGLLLVSNVSSFLSRTHSSFSLSSYVSLNPSSPAPLIHSISFTSAYSAAAIIVSLIFAHCTLISNEVIYRNRAKWRQRRYLEHIQTRHSRTYCLNNAKVQL